MTSERGQNMTEVNYVVKFLTPSCHVKKYILRPHYHSRGPLVPYTIRFKSSMLLPLTRRSSSEKSRVGHEKRME